MLTDFIFYVLAALIMFSAVAVILFPNPLSSALSLAVTMISLGFMFYLLNAYFIASVQLIVYAGAVMVLFVMVLMLFDLKKETDVFSSGPLGQTLKVASAFLILGAIAGAIINTTATLPPMPTDVASSAEQIIGVKALAIKVFTQYLFAFEALGVLLLLIAIGVVAVSRIKGGTHAK